MSAEIYGFADFPSRRDLPSPLQSIEAFTPLGVFSIPKSQLIGFPFDRRPDTNSLMFVIGDSKSSMDAEYLLDSEDYDPEAVIELPIDSDQRLSLLMRILRYFFDALHCTRLAICLTVCNQVDSVKHLTFPDDLNTIKLECVKESPPCLIYVITKCA